MSNAYIPKALRAKVAEQAHHRCGYCLTSEAIVGTPMEMDHLIPQSLGGLTEEDDRWLACSLCNDHKGDRIAALDPVTDEIVGSLIRATRYGRNTSPGQPREIGSMA